MARLKGGPKKKPSADDMGNLTDTLGHKLRNAYGHLLNEPIPDRFFELLQKLDDAAKRKADAGDDRRGMIDTKTTDGE
ncbi:MAG: NepR family anti-sigma factor [Hyphomicrobiaceae bacterium]